jgi:hypothetical protein
MDQHRPRVGISGSYGGFNLGDEAILHAIIGQFRQTRPVNVTVFSRNAEDTLRRHRVERAVPVRELTRAEAREEVRRLDLLVLGGGGILYDGEAGVYLREVMLAHEAQVPVLVYAVSAGPLAEAASRKAVRAALNRVAAITVRDRQGRQLLEERHAAGVSLRRRPWRCTRMRGMIRNVVIGSPGSTYEDYLHHGKPLASFYADLLGWRIIREDWIKIAADETAPLQFAFGDGWSDERPPRWPDPDYPQQLHLDFDVPDLDVAEEQVLALGARRAETQPGGEGHCWLSRRCSFWG